MSKNKNLVVFDLDDTLYKEIEYLKSAFWEIATLCEPNDAKSLFDQMIINYEKNENVFEYVASTYENAKIELLINLYREHKPLIKLESGAKKVLNQLKKEDVILGLITDGRSLTQRNKLKALGITHYFDKIIISEESGFDKKTIHNFMQFEAYQVVNKYYIGDNITKDFYFPNKLGWKSVYFNYRTKHNIHKNKMNIQNEYAPQYEIKRFRELVDLIKKFK